MAEVEKKKDVRMSTRLGHERLHMIVRGWRYNAFNSKADTQERQVEVWAAERQKAKSSAKVSP